MCYKYTVALVSIIVFSTSCYADSVLEWNNIALEAIKQESLSPPVATRALAILHCAIFDSMNAIEGQYISYNSSPVVAPGASAKAASVSAAFNTLSNLLPNQASTFLNKYNSDIASLGPGQSVNDGIATGLTVASEMLDLRSNDGSNNNFIYNGGTDPGEWRPTPPNYEPSLLPLWGSVTPFAIQSGSQFRPAGPPDLSSPEYTAAYNEVKDYGAVNSSLRTPDQTEIAYFWADGVGTYTPPGHWNKIAQTAAAQLSWSEYDNARAFALLNISLADAAISAWDAKHEFLFWRPITAVREGENDTNPLTVGDTDWLPLLSTPPFPEYTSGHSTFSGAAAEVLAGLVGYDNFAFVTDSNGLPGVYRSFDSFSEAAIEAGESRIYGGIHFDFSDYTGRDFGAALSDYVLANYLLPVPEPATLLLVGLGMVMLRRFI
ncbi:MAG: phosphatase PAP2 family protein [Phycisphaerae bacterium]|nr:phosphatase PAP2 family protein [Phycisphaerae bacterium]MDD5381090.1 phosphatase PAP2 family protein [Phycisphaerae bacterium]